MQSRIDRESFLQLPEGCKHTPGREVRLNKALNGLSQSRRDFNQFLMQRLLEFDLERCAADPAIFRRMSPKKRIVSLIIEIYVVDDLIVTGRWELSM